MSQNNISSKIRSVLLQCNTAIGKFYHSNTFFSKPLSEVGVDRDVASIISDYVISPKPALENPEVPHASPKKNK